MTIPAETTNPFAASSDAMVSVRGVTKIYPGGVEALSDVSLDFPKGELTTLLGPPGCGKTTLLKIIAGLLPATRGEIYVAGATDHPSGSRARLRIPGLRPAALGQRAAQRRLRARVRSLPRRAREALAMKYIVQVGLKGFERCFPHELSGGMRQRVGLARALAVNADVLMMDEPFSAVDEQTRRKFQEDMLTLVASERKTFLFVTHSIEEAVYLSDRIVLLSRRPGRVTQIIEPDIPRNLPADRIRRHSAHLDTVETIWQGLRQYLE